MFFWFLACGVIVVALVFDSGGVDYRFVAAGSVLPLVESATGSPWVMHTLAGSAALLFGVMAATAGRGRRLARRRWLGLPVGSLVFLAAGGAWQRAELFWWPAAGLDGLGSGTPPEFDRPLVLLLSLEALGLAGLVLLARSRGLADSGMRRRFLRTGRLARSRSRKA